MQQINELSGMLNQHFKWNKAKMDCFCGMLIGLIKVRSINLTKIANAYPSQAEPDSRYRRIQRFIHDYPVNFDTVACFLMKLFNFVNERFYITLDRTNWQWGEMNINILVLAVVYKGAAIPIYWLVLNKKGNSNMRERIADVSDLSNNSAKKILSQFLQTANLLVKPGLSGSNPKVSNFIFGLKKMPKSPTVRGKWCKRMFYFDF